MQTQDRESANAGQGKCKSLILICIVCDDIISASGMQIPLESKRRRIQQWLIKSATSASCAAPAKANARSARSAKAKASTSSILKSASPAALAKAPAPLALPLRSNLFNR